MAVVSKYLDEAIVKCEKLGLSKHALSRGIVTIAIGAYVAHISYPFVTKLIKAANLSPTALGKNNILNANMQTDRYYFRVQFHFDKEEILND